MSDLSDYSDDDEVRPEARDIVNELANNLRREAEGLKVDGRYSRLGTLMLHAADTLEDTHEKNEYLLDRILTIEDLVNRTLRDV